MTFANHRIKGDEIPQRRLETFNILWERFQCSATDLTGHLLDPRKSSPLQLACFLFCREMIPLLLEKGADPLEIDNKGETALMLLSSSSQQENELQPPRRVEGNISLTNATEIAQLLIRHIRVQNQDVARYLKIQNQNGYTALTWAAQQGHVHLVRYLLQQGANPNVGEDPDEPLPPLQLSPLWAALMTFQTRTKRERAFLERLPQLLQEESARREARPSTGSEVDSELEALQHQKETALKLLAQEQEKLINILKAFLDTPAPASKLSAKSLNRLNGVMSPLMVLVSGRFPRQVIAAVLQAGADPCYRIGDILEYVPDDFRIAEEDRGVSAADDAFRLGLTDLYILLTQAELARAPHVARVAEEARLQERLQAIQERQEQDPDHTAIWRTLEEIYRDYQHVVQRVAKLAAQEILEKKE